MRKPYFESFPTLEMVETASYENCIAWINWLPAVVNKRQEAIWNAIIDRRKELMEK